jgi:hypothetical protein
MPVTRKRKIEVARLAGFGLVLGGLFALFLAVVTSQNAGAEKPSPPANVLHCAQTGDTTGDWLGDAVQYGACQTTTSTDTQASTTYVTTTTKKCGCSHPTTTYVTTTTKHQCGCTTSTTTSGSLPVSSTSSSSSTSTSSTTTPYAPPTTTKDRAPVTQQGGPSTIVSGGIPASSTPVSEAEAVSGQLPFTGSSGLPLAGFGLLMVATGLALALRRHRFAR